MKVAVIIPCYRCREHILGVLGGVPAFIESIVVVDDHCPDGTGDLVRQKCLDPRVQVIQLTTNLGVGGAVISGIQQLLTKRGDIEVFVKLDGDGQMDPQFIRTLVRPILNGAADYTKGNRFASSDHIRGMPFVRLLGNMGLSFISKLSTGYWYLMDPTNGFVAIHRSAVERINLKKLSPRFFFESDLLFRLSLAGAVVVDVPLFSKYGSEVSNLEIDKIFFEFLRKYSVNFVKRVIYHYFVLDFSLASLQLFFGSGLTLFALLFGGYTWKTSVDHGVATPTGTIMIVALSALFGIQFLLSFVSFDVMRRPSLPLQTFGPRNLPSEDLS